MAENTDVNVTEKLRQSKDYPHDFNAENPSVPIKEVSISDDNEVFCEDHDELRFKCWCSEMFSRNQRPEICRGRLNKLSERNSNSSINSFDSGYASRKCTGFFSISEYDEENDQKHLSTSNKTSSTDTSHH